MLARAPGWKPRQHVHDYDAPFPMVQSIYLDELEDLCNRFVKRMVRTKMFLEFFLPKPILNKKTTHETKNGFQKLRHLIELILL